MYSESIRFIGQSDPVRPPLGGRIEQANHVEPKWNPKGRSFSVFKILVTPDIAGYWLDWNSNNRPMIKGRVAAYSRALAAARWMLNGETLKFGTNGRLLDGQNRLKAIVQTGSSAEMLVVFGIAEEAFATIDIGAGRTGGQIFHCDGEENATRLHAICKNCVLWDAEMPFVNVTVTADESKAFLTANPGIREISTIARRTPRKDLAVRASVIGCLLWYMIKLDREWAEQFFDRLADGVGLPEGSPILALRRRLAGDAIRHRTKTQKEEAALIIKAWNAFRSNKTSGRHLAWREDEPFPDLQ